MSTEIDKCSFAEEMKSYVLPTRKDVVGHYLFEIDLYAKIIYCIIDFE